MTALHNYAQTGEYTEKEHPDWLRVLIPSLAAPSVATLGLKIAKQSIRQTSAKHSIKGINRITNRLGVSVITVSCTAGILVASRGGEGRVGDQQIELFCWSGYFMIEALVDVIGPGTFRFSGRYIY
jgi:hypothetical protein